MLGQVVVVRSLSPGTLPVTRLGGPEETKSMLHIAWHMATIGLATVAFALFLSGTVYDGDMARGMGTVAAGASTAFALLATGSIVAMERSFRPVFLDARLLMLIAILVLGWWGVLSL